MLEGSPSQQRHTLACHTMSRLLWQTGNGWDRTSNGCHYDSLPQDVETGGALARLTIASSLKRIWSKATKTFLIYRGRVVSLVCYTLTSRKLSAQFTASMLGVGLLESWHGHRTCLGPASCSECGLGSSQELTAEARCDKLFPV